MNRTLDGSPEEMGAPIAPAHLHELQSLAVMGELAEAVAHDFNNILSGTLIHLGLLLQDAQLSETQKESLKTLEQETTRAAGLMRQLLSFSRRRHFSGDEPIELNKLISGIEKLLQHLVRENVTITFQTSPEECWIKADVGQIEKLVMSLGLLMRDLMPKGGKLLLRTESKILEDIPASLEEKHVGKFICLTLTGSQPAENFLPNDRSPFAESNSSDWKLETARQIALRYEGWIETTSEGSTASVRVYLPMATGIDSDPENSTSIEVVVGGTETILLVEDEEILRRVCTLSLRKLGYGVLDAADGDAALTLWEKHHGKIDLLLTDLLLPGSESGHDLAQRFTARKPSLKVILVSGNHGDLDESDHGDELSFFPAVKPYTVAQLARMVRECLDTPA
jgi:CheY-like chemotaxis protein